MRTILCSSILCLATGAFSQTIEKPIEITMSPVSLTLHPGEHSAVIVAFRVPRGFWLGDNDPSARNPAGTLIEMQSQEHFAFERPQFPAPVVAGVPVRKGFTNIFQGEVRAVVSFTVDENIPDGEYKLTAHITYTPSFDAGRLRSHAREEYSTTVTIARSNEKVQGTPPSPSVGKVPEDFFVREEEVVLPQPWKTILYRWPEGTAIPNFLHWMWVDPENHGKHIQTVWAPFFGITQLSGNTIGMGVALIPTTREGIMTGLLQLRGFYNQYVGTTVALEAVSCPAAYFNYWFSSEISSDGKNKQLHLHIENLNLGDKARFGYDLQLDFFHDPRSRFYGVGAAAREEDQSAYDHQENGTVLDLYWLPAEHLRFAVGGKFRSVDVGDATEGLRDKMPFTTTLSSPGGKFASIPGIKGATVVGERLSAIYDARNSEFSPSDGSYIRVTGEFDQITKQVITAPGPVSQYGRFTADLRKYFSTLDQKITLVLRNGWTFTTSENVPFFDQATLGGSNSDRGFVEGRFHGQHSVFGSMEFRYQTMHVEMMGYPMDVEMAPFVDFGQVFDSKGIKGRFNINPGMSIRILNRPNVGIVGNGAFGQDGLIFTGGVQLPF